MKLPSQDTTIWVAIADDHLMVRSALKRYLEQEPDIRWAGEASDGEGAIILVQTHHVDVMLLDLAMPGLGGLVALPQIRAADPGVRVIVLSAHSSSDVVREAMREGASAFLEKVCEPSQIVDTIRSVLRFPSAMNDPGP